MSKSKPKPQPVAKSSRQLDRAWVIDPAEWYTWPCLPLKRESKKEGYECGVLLAVAGHLTTVFAVNMFELGGKELRESVIDNPAVARHVYADVDALQADGWVVD